MKGKGMDGSQSPWLPLDHQTFPAAQTLPAGCGVKPRAMGYDGKKRIDRSEVWARQATSPSTKPSSYPVACWLHLNHSCQIPVQSVHYFHMDRRFSGLVDQSLFFCDLCPVRVSKDARLLLACWHLKNIALLLTFKKTYAGIFSYAGKISYDLWPFCKRWVAHYASAVGVAERKMQLESEGLQVPR